MPSGARLIAWLGCTGLSARALVYFLVSGLMIKATLLPDEDESGVGPVDAFRAVETSPFGQAILLLIGGGLMVYAVWRLQQGLFDGRNEGDDWSGRAARAGMAMSGVSYALIGLAAILVTFGANRSDGTGITEDFSAWLLDQPFGSWALMGCGATLAVIGGVQVWRGQAGRWCSHVDLDRWPRLAKPAVTVGIVGRGLLIALVGVFMSLAAWTLDASEARGIAGSLAWLRAQPFGFWIYAGGALVLGLYGLYSAMQAHSCAIRRG